MLRVVTAGVPVEDVGVVEEQGSGLNCCAAKEGNVAWEIVEGRAILGKSIGLKGKLGLIGTYIF